MAPSIFFQLPSSCLTYPGFSDKQENCHSRQDSQQVGEPEAPVDGGSQWTPHSMWYLVATVLSVWAPVEDWEMMDTSQWKAFPTFLAHIKMRPASRGNSRHSLVGGAACQKTPIPWSALDKNPMAEPNSKAILWIKAQHEGADRKSTRLNSSHTLASRMPSSA